MKYPLPIRAIHWSSALIILGLIALGFYMTPFEVDNMEHSENLYFWHKSFGILAFILVCLRLLLRSKHTLPALPQGMPKHEKLAAKIAHKALYVLMILVPILGYIQSCVYPYSSGIHFFGLLLPELFSDNMAIFEVVNLIHKVLAYSLLALIAAHVLGAIKHRLFDKENDVLNRMI
ncbi:MAG: cytochrome b [Moritella sp.]|uniref:cytochrome b n=1 Tax=Moritella sp. TaxID=78556 RepID=UPI0029ADE30C|nr:cytochrome b [Moritella sp.]MDX2320999.1 cytochrome b [Moritella sp.]